MDRSFEGSVLRDALDRANEEFRRSTVEFQSAIQFHNNGASGLERDLAVRRASRIQAEAGDALLLALSRFEAFVLARAGAPDAKRSAAAAALAGSRD